MAFQKRFYRHRGITILQKRDPGIARIRRSKVALVLAGGAITGGAFKVGGLRALDEMFVCRRSPGGGCPAGTDLPAFRKQRAKIYHGLRLAGLAA